METDCGGNMNLKIDDIILKHQNLFGKMPDIKKINAGFTNFVYSINDSFVLKICINSDNEENFQKEINFYKNNENSEYIPKFYYCDTSKKTFPYMYEIIEKIEGKSLYDLWHALSEEKREEIIKEICKIMKFFHSKKESSFNWMDYNKKVFMELYEKALSLGVFTKKEQKLINEAYDKFDKYLISDEFVLVHNDIHFDNITYNDGKIKIIDFERSLVAPKDFELDILYRMIKKPWKYANEDNGKYTNKSDYSNIPMYIEKYYPELVDHKYLPQRLAIYDVIYNLKHLIKNIDSKELKKDVMDSIKIIIKNSVGKYL